VCELAHNLAFGNRLRSLKLSHNSFGDDGIQCLGKSLEKSPLEELDLNGCIDISDVGLRAFIAKVPLSQLFSLDLEIWCFGEDTLDELIIASNNSQIYQLAFYSPGYHRSAIYDDFKQFGIDRNFEKCKNQRM